LNSITRTFIISTETGAGAAAAGGGDAAAKEVLLKNVGWEIQGISSDSWLNWKLGIIFWDTKDCNIISRSWFQIFYIFTPSWGIFPV